MPIFLEQKQLEETWLKKIAWYYNVNRYGYLMKPENWVIVYDDLLKYYDANKENEEKTLFSNSKKFWKRST